MAAVIGTAIVGAVVGGVVNKAMGGGRKSAGGSSDPVAWEREKMDEWREIYGDIEQNLADYYTDLTPEKLTAAGLEDEAEGFATAKKNITTRIAQRGIEGSGLEAEMIAKQEIGSAEKRAEIRTTAEDTVREKQQAFLQGGKGEKGRIEGRQRNLMDQQAARDRQAEQSATQSTAEIVGAGMKKWAQQPPSAEASAPAMDDFDLSHNVGYGGYEGT